MHTVLTTPIGYILDPTGVPPVWLGTYLYNREHEKTNKGSENH